MRWSSPGETPGADGIFYFQRKEVAMHVISLRNGWNVIIQEEEEAGATLIAIDPTGAVRWGTLRGLDPTSPEFARQLNDMLRDNCPHCSA